MSGLVHEKSVGKTVEWYTPPYIFDALGIRFSLDPCSPGKDVCSWIPADTCYTQLDDGLSKEWHGRVWLNPPYGRSIPEWLSRLAIHGNGIALLFARTSTKWFQRYVARADAVCFIEKKISFIDSGTMCKGGNPGSGSILIAYGKECAEAVRKSGLGMTLEIPK